MTTQINNLANLLNIELSPRDVLDFHCFKPTKSLGTLVFPQSAEELAILNFIFVFEGAHNSNGTIEAMPKRYSFSNLVKEYIKEKRPKYLSKIDFVNQKLNIYIDKGTDFLDKIAASAKLNKYKLSMALPLVLSLALLSLPFILLLKMLTKLVDKKTASFIYKQSICFDKLENQQQKLFLAILMKNIEDFPTEHQNRILEIANLFIASPLGQYAIEKGYQPHYLIRTTNEQKYIKNELSRLPLSTSPISALQSVGEKIENRLTQTNNGKKKVHKI